MPCITVVMPVYNHAAYVEQTLHSLFAQDYRDFQIVVVDTRMGFARKTI
jgi:glycosyltransferase involved in cell wall biosynthesis